MLRLELLMDEWSFSSLSARPRLSQGRAAIHRSSQLHPHVGLVGSTNIGFIDLDEFFPFCCHNITFAVVNKITVAVRKENEKV
jgi:hypothetical protein